MVFSVVLYSVLEIVGRDWNVKLNYEYWNLFKLISNGKFIYFVREEFYRLMIRYEGYIF